MKKSIIFITILFFSLITFSQEYIHRSDVKIEGKIIGEKGLSVVNGIKVGNTLTPVEAEIVYDGTNFKGYNGDSYIVFGGSGAYLTYFNGTILRNWNIDQEFSGTVEDYLAYMLFAPPTISMTITPQVLFEVGDTATITITGITSNKGNATLFNGVLKNITNNTPLTNYGNNDTVIESIFYKPTQSETSGYYKLSYNFRCEQNWEKDSESGLATKNIEINSVYPYLYGMSAMDLTGSGNPYTELSDSVVAESNVLCSFTGDDKYIYFLVDKNYGYLTLIKDQNGYDITLDYDVTTVSVSSDGLVNNWTKDYYMYKSTIKKYGLSDFKITFYK